MKNFKLFPYLLVFLATFLILQLFSQGERVDPVLSEGDVALQTAKNDYAVGKDVRVELQNNTEADLTLEYPCKIDESGRSYQELPFEVLEYQSSGFEPVGGKAHPDCLSQSLTLEPGKKKVISLVDYSYSYFSEPGRYKLRITMGENSFDSPEFEIREPGVVTKLWRLLIYQPILNLLVAALIYIPGHPLWAGIMVLTLVIRTLLLIPSQKGIRAQMRMQELQPKLEEIKKKYANDQARLAQETMMLWKTHKVSPFSSCLPILIQFPILIALFYAVKGGLSPDRSFFIYDFLPDFNLAMIDPQFLNFNLLEQSLLIFPLVVGGLQFVQMQFMSTQRRSVTTKKNGDKTHPEEKKLPSEIETANKMMKYIMPVMIAIFTAQLPAAVGLYWATSTFYGIIQQLVVNKKGPASTSSTDDVEIRVINRSHENGKAN